MVDKTAALQGGLGGLPRFVTEFMLAEMLRRRKAKSPKPALMDRLREKIRLGLVDASNKGAFLARLMDDGMASMIGNVWIDPRPEKDTFYVHIAQLGDDTRVHISDSVRQALCAKHPQLLSGSVWGSVGLIYAKGMGIELVSFEPFQLTMTPRDIERFAEGREKFNTLEWIDLLLNSIGYNPAALETPKLPHPGDPWKVGEKTHTLVSHPEWYVAYPTGEMRDTGRTRDTGKKDDKKKPTVEPIPHCGSVGRHYPRLGAAEDHGRGNGAGGGAFFRPIGHGRDDHGPPAGGFGEVLSQLQTFNL